MVATVLSASSLSHAANSNICCVSVRCDENVSLPRGDSAFNTCFSGFNTLIVQSERRRESACDLVARGRDHSRKCGYDA